jgi:two-component system, cell cycle sensor histidine kinase PleC
MIGGSSHGKSNSLMSEYASLLGDAVLRHRTRVAEHSARIEGELASKVKSEFIANMSHELRTPLNTVIGFSKLLSEHDRRHLKDEDIVQYAALIHDSAGHLLAVINDILDISKIQSGKYTLDAREIAIDELLHIAVASLEMMSADAGVTIEKELAADLPAIRGDSVKLRQVFSNIIGNAIKFTRSGGLVTIRAGRQSDGGILIEIADTGIGMTDDEIKVAMTPFGQVDSSRARWREGTGLGLPISKSLIELHSGKLAIRSEKDVGTVVSVTLPSRHSVTALHKSSPEVSPRNGEQPQPAAI